MNITQKVILVAASVFLAGVSLSVAQESQPLKLIVQEDHITVKGKDVPVMAIKQEDGQSGYSPQKADNFHVEVVNQLKVPTTILWHGLVLPNLMDGVPFVTQNPIPPGGKFDYQFPLKQSGTYWMHSHYGLQEQLLNSAPLVIWTPEEQAKADVQYVVMLSDFSFTSPADILKKLKTGMPKPKDAKKMPAATPAAGMEMGPKETLYAQKWDPEAKRFTRAEAVGPVPDIDVHYDALLANRHTVDHPDTLAVKPGQTVLLRLIAASSATDFLVDTGGLDAEILAVDGQPVEPLKGSYFQLAVAQRIDLRVTIPETGGAFPILFQGEGTKLLAGVVLVTEGATVPPMPSICQKPKPVAAWASSAARP